MPSFHGELFMGPKSATRFIESVESFHFTIHRAHTLRQHHIKAKAKGTPSTIRRKRARKQIDIIS